MLAEFWGNGSLANLPGLGVERHVDDRTRAGGEGRTIGLIRRENPKAVAQAAGADFLNPQADFQGLFKARGPQVFARDLQTRPPLMRRAIRGMDANAQGAKERVLGAFHKAKKIREVHEAGEVGIREFDHPAVAEVKVFREDFVGVQGEIG